MNNIKFHKLYDLTLEAFYKKKKFILFRKPYENKIYLHIDSLKLNNLKYINNSYFIINDFYNQKYIKIYTNKIFYSEIEFVKNNNNNFHKLKNLKHHKYDISYINNIKKSLNELKNNFLKKIVISRQKKIKYKYLNLKNSIQNLLFNNIESFVNIWYEPISELLWMGATPELLFYLNLNKKKLISVALAGTKKLNNKYWYYKEIKEHYLVVNYILNIFNTYFKYNLSIIHRTNELITGNIKHLKTKIEYYLLNKYHYKYILKYLYPTPAICGSPKTDAYKFILKNENYNRSYYTGSIGIINNNIIEFYINLRCINIDFYKNIITVYAGCGITHESNILKEYFENEYKMQNILSNIIFYD